MRSFFRKRSIQPVPVDQARMGDTQPMVQRELGGRLAGLSLPQQVYVLAIWPLLEQLLSFGVGFVDTILAGHLSVDAANAMGVAMYVSWLIKIIQSSVAIGAAAIVARAIGARHKRLANAALGQSLILGAAAGLLMGALIFAAAPIVAEFVGLTGLGAEHGVTYLRIESASAVLSALLLVGGACLRAAGDTRSPFVVISIVNVVNAIASVTLVYAPAPIGGHGIAGIAGGTVIAWAVGAVLIIALLLSGHGGIRLHMHRLRPHAHTLRRILRVGVPSLFESVGLWAGNFLVIKIVGGLTQHAALGAHMVAVRIEALSFMSGYALGVAAATLTGQYLGLGDARRAALCVRWCWGIAMGVMFLMGLMFFFAPWPLVRIVTNQPELLELAPNLLRIAGPVQIFFGTYMVLSQAMRGAGDTRAAMLMMFASTFLIRLPAAYFLGHTMGYGLNGVWLALCGELVVRGIMFAARFFHGGWAKVQV